jgi:hypothetical protein
MHLRLRPRRPRPCAPPLQLRGRSLRDVAPWGRGAGAVGALAALPPAGTSRRAAVPSVLQAGAGERPALQGQLSAPVLLCSVDGRQTIGHGALLAPPPAASALTPFPPEQDPLRVKTREWVRSA